MSVKAIAAKIFAKTVYAKTQKWASDPVATQQKVFNELISGAKDTQFGKDHDFAKIKTTEDFAQLVPIRDYEALKPYVDRVVQGEENILWKGKSLYVEKTTVTSSCNKYIPIRK